VIVSSPWCWAKSPRAVRRAATCTRCPLVVVHKLEGTLSIEVEGYETQEVKAGESFTEVIYTWHNGRNVGSTPARFLIVFAGQDGTPIAMRL
jgi:quercetin dioxygenase-like cupin family protein